VRTHPDLAEEAQAVCDEMAHRVRSNVQVIIERLSGAGYRFHSNDDDHTPTTPYLGPTATAGEHADWLQERWIRDNLNSPHTGAVVAAAANGRLTDNQGVALAELASVFH
jgi:hypothetical protein